MALAACVRALFLPGAWPRGPARRGARLRSAALGRATTGGGVGARRAMSHRVLVEAGPAAGVAVLKFRNPPVNALSLEMLTELVISLEKLENDKAIRGVVITAENPGIFLAGLDLVELCGQNPAHYAEYWEAVQELWLRLYQSNKVLVAAINDTLVNTIGHRAAEQALQLGMLFPPAKALQVGIVDQVVPEEQLQSTALSVMAQWLAIPDHARQLTKTMMRKPTVDQLVKQREADIQSFVSFISQDSIQRALQTYLQKLRQKKG
ncbi:enoyl-CoA delta isomerase 1, mitochondrial isoform 5-T5 [Dugong dugon]